MESMPPELYIKFLEAADVKGKLCPFLFFNFKMRLFKIRNNKS